MEKRSLAHAIVSIRQRVFARRRESDGYLAITTIAVEADDLVTTIFRMQHEQVAVRNGMLYSLRLQKLPPMCPS